MATSSAPTTIAVAQGATPAASGSMGKFDFYNEVFKLIDEKMPWAPYVIVVLIIVFLVVIIYRLITASNISFWKFKFRGKPIASRDNKIDYKKAADEHGESVKQCINAFNSIGDLIDSISTNLPCDHHVPDDFLKNVDKVFDLLEHLSLQLPGHKGTSDLRRFCVFEPVQLGGETYLEMHHCNGFYDGEKNFRPKVTEGIVGRCYRFKQLELCSDVAKDRDFIKNPYSERQIKSLLYVPIIVRKSVVGVINIDSPNINAFTEIDIIIVKTLAKLWAMVHEIKECTCIPPIEALIIPVE